MRVFSMVGGEHGRIQCVACTAQTKKKKKLERLLEETDTFETDHPHPYPCSFIVWYGVVWEEIGWPIIYITF